MNNENLIPKLLGDLGVDPSEVTRIALIRERHGNRIYRVVTRGSSFVLKTSESPSASHEVRCYALLQKLGVPTLPVHAATENALLLEDLSTSPAWRLAEESDTHRPDVGAAVAEWYKALHAAGRAMVESGKTPTFLEREVDLLNPESVIRIGLRLGTGANPVWQLAAAHIESLKAAERSLSETLNYNDFHWTNLALSRRDDPLLAIVFDYHLLGIGMAYSDVRNVAGSLGEAAKREFWKTYGAVDERQVVLDRPLSVLHALVVAFGMPQMPAWAEELTRRVESGELTQTSNDAIRFTQDSAKRERPT